MPSLQSAVRLASPCDDSGPEIVLFTWRLESCATAARQLEHLLSDDERIRRDRFLNPRNGARFASGRAELRRILAAKLGKDPSALRFQYDAYGKPELAEPGLLHFNLSHTQDQAVLALSQTHAVGVDIETVGKFEETVARLLLTDLEFATLSGLPEGQRRILFYRYWTCKEAIVKAVGCGLSVFPRSVGVAFDDDGEAYVKSIDASFGPERSWRLYQLDHVPGCVGALAVRLFSTRG